MWVQILLMKRLAHEHPAYLKLHQKKGLRRCRGSRIASASPFNLHMLETTNKITILQNVAALAFGLCVSRTHPESGT